MKGEALGTQGLQLPSLQRCPDVFQEEIKESLVRCKKRNLDANTKLMSAKTDTINKQVIKEFCAPILKLLNFASGDNLVVLLADKHGIAVDLQGSIKALSKLQEAGITVGVDLREEVAGTNAYALALIHKKPICVIGKNHYNQHLKEWSSFCAPITSQNGKIEGLVGLWCYDLKRINQTSYVNYLLGLVSLVANVISREWYIKEIKKELIFHKEIIRTLADYITEEFLVMDCERVIKYVSSAIMNCFGKNVIGKKLGTLNRSELTELVESDSKRPKEVYLTGSPEGEIYLAKAKPIKALENNQLLGNIVVLSRMKGVQSKNHRSYTAHFTFDDIIGNSPSLRKAVEMARAAAELNVRVLLEGESGTGKELFAQAIHNGSARRNGPFVALNCSAVPRELFESEFFGYSEGAFTGAKKGGKPGKFELANGGTLFLDEIGTLPWDMQAKLLRTLQQNEIIRVGGNEVIPVNVRIVAATNTPLEELVVQGEFRQDLYYRLNVIVIRIPPLRERVEDIPVLFEYLVEKISRKLGKKIRRIDKDVIDVLCAYHWPGNVRELENCIERAITLARENIIRVEDLPSEVLQGKSERRSTPPGELQSLRTLERETIVRSLARFNGNVSKASKALGISRTTLYKKMRQYDIRIR
ncbi:sigma-54 interaction domain-containing protein [Thermanaeromonas sp. C210]|uniref:sigma-54 interaction domain-containing protein n=1 Tax=Thermanaeromonas sp. C210 TaxID=2731925 RepID=UPI001567A64A|nr:sigma 54-interacting transcriptional regulator [Thermanaeromonas sp. C210]